MIHYYENSILHHEILNLGGSQGSLVRKLVPYEVSLLIFTEYKYLWKFYHHTICFVSKLCNSEHLIPSLSRQQHGPKGEIITTQLLPPPHHIQYMYTTILYFLTSCLFVLELLSCLSVSVLLALSCSVKALYIEHTSTQEQYLKEYGFVLLISAHSLIWRCEWPAWAWRRPHQKVRCTPAPACPGLASCCCTRQG